MHLFSLFASSSGNTLDNENNEKQKLLQLITDFNDIIQCIRQSIISNLFVKNNTTDLMSRYNVLNKKTVIPPTFVESLNRAIDNTPLSSEQRMNMYKLYFNEQFLQILHYINMLINHPETPSMYTALSYLSSLRLKDMEAIVQTAWLDYQGYEKNKRDIDMKIRLFGSRVYQDVYFPHVIQ